MTTPPARHFLFLVASARESGHLGNTEWLARQAAQAVLVGTYAAASQAVYVSLKLVSPHGNAVLAAHDYALPMDGNVRGLLVGEY